MSIKIRTATSNNKDIEYILYCNKKIEGDHAGLTKQHLLADILCPTPKAYILIIEENNQPIGMILYSYSYWASDGNIMWISQTFIDKTHRGKHFFKVVNLIKSYANQQNCKVITWMTADNATRTNKLWQRLNAKSLKGIYSSWVIKL